MSEIESLQELQRTLDGFRVAWCVAMVVLGPVLAIFGAHVCRVLSSDGSRLLGPAILVSMPLLPMAALAILVSAPGRLSLLDHHSEAMWGLLIGFCLAITLGVGMAVAHYFEPQRPGPRRVKGAA